jgi:hypothetical protein
MGHQHFPHSSKRHNIDVIDHRLVNFHLPHSSQCINYIPDDGFRIKFIPDI